METKPSLAVLAASPALLALVLALLLPGWRTAFLALLLLGAVLVSLTAVVRVFRCLRGAEALAFAIVTALVPLLPLAAGMMLLALARLTLLWRSRHLPESEAVLLAPGFPLLDAALVAGAALTAVSA